MLQDWLGSTGSTIYKLHDFEKLFNVSMSVFSPLKCQ